MSKTLKKFCRLNKFLEQTDKNLYQVFDDLCIMHLLKPNRKSNGITFLYPTEKSYRQRIINAAYSTDPDVAVNMIKSLILQEFFGDCSDFSKGAVNLLNQKLEIEKTDSGCVKLANGLSLKKSKNFSPMSYRENMAVYELSGKGEIPLNGKVGKVPEKKGGNLCKISHSGISDLVHDEYKKDMGFGPKNIYIKKVHLQLGAILRKHGIDPNSENYPSNFDPDLVNYLGNDEFSDSYLLDIYCSKHCSSCIQEVTKCLKSKYFNRRCYDILEEINSEKYLDRKQKVCIALTGSANANEEVSERPEFEDLRSNITSPAEVRSRVKKYYKGNEKQLGRDLFIVFTGLSKYLWKTDPEVYESYHYLSSKVYKDLDRLVKSDFDVARDLSIWGNLLKSDAFLYKPQAKFDTVPAAYSGKTDFPSAIMIEPFSINKLQEQYREGSTVGGVKGGSEISGLAELELYR